MKGFVISWFFPPMNSSEGLVTFKLLKKSKYNYDVFTQSTCKNWSYGNTEKKLVSKNINPIYSSKETYDEWIKEGVDYFLQNQDKYDFIMSRATPKESHILAKKIKEKVPEVKWIASFGDPLSESPYEKSIMVSSPYSLKERTWKNTSKKYIISPKRIIKNIIWAIKHRENKYVKKDRLLAADIQNYTILNADVLIFNNRYQMKYMLSKYDESVKKKALILNHSYDIDFYPKKVTFANDKKKIVYLGHLDNIRNASAFLQGIKLVKDKNPKLSEKLEVEFYGNMSDNDKLFIVNNELYDVVKIRKPVDYFTSLKLMQENEWLLLVDANVSNVLDYNPYFAAKLADYIGTHNKILAITMNKGASFEIIKSIGGVTVGYDANKIGEIINNIVLNKIKYNENKQESEKYSNTSVAKIYDEYVSKMLRKGNNHEN